MTRWARSSIRHRHPELAVPPFAAGLNLPLAAKARRRIVIRHGVAAGVVIPTGVLGQLADRADEFIASAQLKAAKQRHRRKTLRRRQRAARKVMRRATK